MEEIFQIEDKKAVFAGKATRAIEPSAVLQKPWPMRLGPDRA
jgi:hypothetical protein